MKLNRFKEINLLVSVLLLTTVFATPSFGYELRYDNNGNIIEDEEFTYVYNDANRLSEVRNADGLVAKYWYDHSGRRIKKELADGTITYYPFEEYEETHYPDGSVEKTSYYFANGERIAKKVNGEVFYYLPDHLGSTDVVTDSNGNLVEKTKYLPFGGVREGGSERYGFTGQEKDPETDLMYYGARYYDPVTRKFTQPDTIIQDPYDPQTLNRYAYVRNNPVKHTDPSGHIIPLLFAVIVIVGVGSEVAYLSTTEDPTLEGTITAGVVGGTAAATGYGAAGVTAAGATAAFGTSTAGLTAGGAVTAVTAWGTSQITSNVLTGQPIEQGMTPENAAIAAITGGVFGAISPQITSAINKVHSKINRVTKSTGYRYVSGDEATQISKTGTIQPKSRGTYVSWDRYSSSSQSASRLQMPKTPTHRASYDASSVRHYTPSRQGNTCRIYGELGEGGGSQALLKDPVKIKDIVPLKK